MARKKAESKLTSAARTLGAAGASKGGKARAKAITPDRARAIATMGGKAKARKKKT